jgi:hypothetical protein
VSIRADSVSPILAGFLTLPRLLALDGVTCVLMGALLTIAAVSLATALALPAGFLFVAGIVLFPCALLMFTAAARPPWTAALACLVIALNAAWVVGSVLVVPALFPANRLGLSFVFAQAIAVAAIAILEFQALRRWRAGGARR